MNFKQQLHHKEENGLLSPIETKGHNSFVRFSDKELWMQFKSGNEAAFIHIYQHYFDGLVNFCFQFTADENLIKDTVQDLFIYIRNKREKLASTDNIKLYLYKSCRNNILKTLSKRHKDKALTELEGDFFPPTISVEEHIINLQTREINERSLMLAIEKLSAREREVIYYFYFENLEYKEIAEILGFKEVKSVRSLLYKAVNKLRGFIITLFFVLFSFHF